ncbi:MAG TPA: DEAD/DEAH box helicase, partial [Candidatus Bathyarchaeia archaeon]|nr:DEAD/DEAH box helicase [Candidatus Bathyarchaeia archaeon]
MKISDLPIDNQVVQLLANEGLAELYPPQQHAIEAGVLRGKNLVLASPTASGKTLVAELCIMQHVLEHRGKAIYLSPLRALASEKFKEFQRYSTIRKPTGDNVRVGISTGDYDSADPWLGRYDIILCTNEKADSLLRHKAPWMSELTLVVADEIHLLTEQERGPTLEVVLTRLREINPNIQVLALSATVRNADEVGAWLNSSAVTTDWRPVPLREGIYHDNQVQFRDGDSRAILTGTKTPSLDIALDVLSTGGQALIFTETRRSAVEMGRKASVAVKSRLSKPEERALNTIAERILSTGEKTRLSEALAMQIASGAGFHHAGLAGFHRGIVEEAFRDGRIKILAATPTLAAGVNLPARAVVISSYERYEAGYGRYPISVLEYKQFCLPQGTGVTLYDGSTVPIENLVKARTKTNVLSISNPHGVVQKPIGEYFERETDEFVEISTNIGRTLTATPEHPVLTRSSDGNPSWMPLGSLKPNDLVAYVREIVPSDREVSWLSLLPVDTTYVANPISFFCRKRIPWRYKDVSERLGIKLKTFKTYTSHSRNPPLRVVIALSELLGLERECVSSEVKFIKSKWGKPIRLPPILNDDFMWLLGIIASDGNLKKSKSNRRGSYYHIRVFNKDKRIIGKTVSILKALGLSPRITLRREEHLTVELASTQLGRIIEQFGIPHRKKSLEISVPDFMLRFPRHLLGAYLGGVFDGDGSYSESSYAPGTIAKVRAIVIATGSEKFASGIHDLLLRIGIVCSIIRDARHLRVTIDGRVASFPNPVYRVTIRRIADIQRFLTWAKPVKEIPSIEYGRYHNIAEFRQTERNRPFIWVKVTRASKKKLPMPAKVYNLSIKDTETYLASNFIVHNCGRAGRPKYDKFGEAMLIARNPDEAEWLMENYVLAQPERLWSKLAAERVLRPHVLSTIAAGYAHSE